MRVNLSIFLLIFLFTFKYSLSNPTPYPCSYEACNTAGHDPSAMQRTANGYYVILVTGNGSGDAFGMRYLDPNDPTSGWKMGEFSYMVPKWLNDLGWGDCTDCGDKCACAFWAPDLPSNGNGLQNPNFNGSDEFNMYYSIVQFDDQTADVACIGKATGTFHNPTDNREAWIDWKDQGSPVVCTNTREMDRGAPHAIDPSVGADNIGNLWLTYGSWSDGGIVAVQLDADTGMLNQDVLSDCQVHFPFCWSHSKENFPNIANKDCDTPGNCDPKYQGNAIEASYLYHHKGTRDVFLFVNYYWCCRGMESTYEIRVGRQTEDDLNFYDKDGVDMNYSAGTLLVSNKTKTNQHKMVGPGHAGIMLDQDGSYVFTFDYMAVDSNDEGYWYRPQARKLIWDEDGWPVVTEDNWYLQTNNSTWFMK